MRACVCVVCVCVWVCVCVCARVGVVACVCAGRRAGRSACGGGTALGCGADGVVGVVERMTCAEGVEVSG